MNTDNNRHDQYEAHAVSDSPRNLQAEYDVPFTLIYLVVSTLLLIGATITDWIFFDLTFYQIVFFVVIPFVVYLGIKFIGDFNAWKMALVTAVQPMLIYYFWYYIYTPSISLATMNSIPHSIIIFPIYVLLVCAILLLIVRKSLTKKVFGLSGITHYFSQKETPIVLIERAVIFLAALVTFIAYLIKK